MIHRFTRNWHWLSLLGLLAMLPLFPPPTAAVPADNPDVAWTGFLSQPSKHTSSWIAHTYLAEHKKRIGLRDPHTDMIVTAIDKDDQERTHVHLQRMLYRTPVWGDHLVIEIDEDGIIRQVVGTIHPNLERRLFHRALHPAIGAREASAIAGQWLQSQQLPDRPISDASLYYLPDSTSIRLIYAIGTDRGNRVFVHALSGRVILPNI